MEDKKSLMQKLGKKQLLLELKQPLAMLPEALKAFEIELKDEGYTLVYTFDTQAERTGITTVLDALRQAQINFRDLSTTQSSLEDIFVRLVEKV